MILLSGNQFGVVFVGEEGPIVNIVCVNEVGSSKNPNLLRTLPGDSETAAEDVEDGVVFLITLHFNGNE